MDRVRRTLYGSPDVADGSLLAGAELRANQEPGRRYSREIAMGNVFKIIVLPPKNPDTRSRAPMSSDIDVHRSACSAPCRWILSLAACGDKKSAKSPESNAGITETSAREDTRDRTGDPQRQSDPL